MAGTQELLVILPAPVLVWTGKARVGSRATAVTIARERAVFHDAIGYPSGAPGRAKNRRTVR